VWHNQGVARPSRPAPPLDGAALERLALRYVERFATTRGRLRQYLVHKIRERGWSEDAAPDTEALAERMAAIGYVDDVAFGEAKAASMARRGLGSRRVDQALRHAGIEEEDRGALQPAIDDRAYASALAYARRRRLGPYAATAPDRDARQRATAAMLRAGHSFDLTRRILDMPPGEEPDERTDPGQTVLFT
jgi:regulatory protein